jgi:2-haloacid dehalogenase
MTRVLAFDVNETLLDVRALAPHFRKVLGTDDLLAPWFGRLLRGSLVATITKTYQRFDELGVQALRATALEASVEIDESTARRIVDEMRRLPAHPDAPDALARLAAAGFRLVTLTNSAPDVVVDQMRNARLDGYFETLISVDAVSLFKPHPATYRYAADQLGIDIGQLRLVAAHDWDVTGAIRAGAKAAFVARHGSVLTASSETPDIVETDLGLVADRIIDIEGPSQR